MITLYVVFSILLLFILGLYWFMPAIMPPTLPFGVRVPPDRSDAAVITGASRDYRVGVLVSGLLSLAIGWFCAQTISPILGGSGELILALVLLMLNYYSAHLRIKRVKARERWYEGVHQVIIADTEAHTQPGKPNKALLLLPVLLFVIMVVIAIVRYTALPAQVPTHFGLNGEPDRWSSRLTAVIMMPAIGACMTALLIWISLAVTRARQQIEPSNPQADIQYQRKVRQLMRNMILWIATFVNLTFLLVELNITLVLPTNTDNMSLLLLLSPTLLIIVLLAVMLYEIRKLRAHMPSLSSTGRTNEKYTAMNQAERVAARDDDRYWLAGMIYYNPEDPAVWVSKRFGIGYTINFGNLTAKIISVAFVVIIIAITVVPRLFK
ncbi:membrane protein [Ktedonobacteria bacterium brp13]|nr:membrane protein [Ktedonobacteria bacterium brp13]